MYARIVASMASVKGMRQNQLEAICSMSRSRIRLMRRLDQEIPEQGRDQGRVVWILATLGDERPRVVQHFDGVLLGAVGGDEDAFERATSPEALVMSLSSFGHNARMVVHRACVVRSTTVGDSRQEIHRLPHQYVRRGF